MSLDSLVGTTLADRYRVVAPLGKGGMGQIFLVEHTLMNKEFALKVLNPELSRNEEIAMRFEREAKAAALLDHPNIINVTDFGRTHDGLCFLVMERVRGRSLTNAIQPDENHPGKPLPVHRALRIMRQILRALDHAHGSGVIHRDLKPDNIMLVDRGGEHDLVKLLDFGIAKITSGRVRDDVQTQSGMVFGTPEYLSPEQTRGEESDARADLYAAGIVLYEMLTGRRPFEAESRVDVLAMQVNKPARPMRAVAPTANIPPGLERVVDRAMAKNREERFASAIEFLDALDRSLVGGGRSRIPIELFTVLWRWPSAFFRALTDRARVAGVPWPRAFSGALVVFSVAFVAILFAALLRHGHPPSPITGDLDRIESMIQRGDLKAARLALDPLEMTHSNVARVHLLRGHLSYAEGEREGALDAYLRTVRLDGSYKIDPLLLGNSRSLLDRKGDVAPALELYKEIGRAGEADLKWCARSCRSDKVRRAAQSLLDGKPAGKSAAKPETKKDRE